MFDELKDPFAGLESLYLQEKYIAKEFNIIVSFHGYIVGYLATDHKIFIAGCTLDPKSCPDMEVSLFQRFIYSVMGPPSFVLIIEVSFFQSVHYQDLTVLFRGL